MQWHCRLYFSCPWSVAGRCHEGAVLTFANGSMSTTTSALCCGDVCRTHLSRLSQYLWAMGGGGLKSKHFTVFSSSGDHTYSFPQRLVLKDVIQPMCCDAVVNSMWRAISLVLTHQLIMDDLRCVGRDFSFLHFLLYWFLHGVLSLLLS